MRRYLPFLLCLACFPAWGAAQKVLDTDVPATGVTQLFLDASQGEVSIKPSGDERVHVRLELKQQQHWLFWLFDWYSDQSASDLQAAELKALPDNGALKLVLTYPAGRHPGDIGEKWTVLVPARLALDANLGEGALFIRGVAGGVRAHVHAGDLDISVPQGSLDASVQYGRVHAITAETSPGAISVASGHGLAALDWNGKYYGPPEQQGFWAHVHLGGNSVAQRGGGGNDLKLLASFGEADLRVGSLGEVKDYRDLFQESKDN